MINFKNIRQLAPMFYKLLVYFNFIKRCAKDDTASDYSYTYRNLVFRKEIFKLNKHAFNIILFKEGLDKVGDGQVLFAPNHQSFADIITMFLSSDRAIGFVSKKETKDLPKTIATGMKAIGNVLIDRDDLRSEVIAFKQINTILEENKDLSYVVFPEGTRSKPPEFKLGDFHSGSFKIATKLGIPIVPVCIYGDKRILDKHVHLKKYPVQIKFLDPITSDEYDKITPIELSDMIHQRMEKELSILKSNDYKLLQVLNNYSDKKLDKLKKVEQNKRDNF